MRGHNRYKMGDRNITILCYADDPVVIAQDDLQRLLYRFNFAAKSPNMVISTSKEMADNFKNTYKMQACRNTTTTEIQISIYQKTFSYQSERIPHLVETIFLPLIDMDRYCLKIFEKRLKQLLILAKVANVKRSLNFYL